MVGGGIFAVLGLSVKLTGGGAPLAFFIAGMVALVTSYSYASLSVRYPSQGDTVSFLDRAFGPGLLTGTANILLWLSYIACSRSIPMRSGAMVPLSSPRTVSLSGNTF
ncbi:hypothetical protein [Marinobacter antarcticus]|uniref:hypothetical protein n=1 Tax=Marinobacter antarcticus TaxID=564117 RepID=UPI003898D92D